MHHSKISFHIYIHYGGPIEVFLVTKAKVYTILSVEAASIISLSEWSFIKEGNALFNDTLSTFSYGYMVKDHSHSERGNLLPPHVLFPISSKGSFICTIPQTG